MTEDIYLPRQLRPIDSREIARICPGPGLRDFDNEKVLQFVGYSRDVYSASKQHLVVSQTQYCYWLKVQTRETQPHYSRKHPIKLDCRNGLQPCC